MLNRARNLLIRQREQVFSSFNNNVNKRRGLSRAQASNWTRHQLFEYREELSYLTGLVVVCLYSLFICDFTICEGASMEPTFDTAGETVYYSMLGKKYKRGDVVIAEHPRTPDMWICKRIAAVENDVIFEKRGYNQHAIIRVPPGHYYLRGDNSSNSTGTPPCCCCCCCYYCCCC